MSNKQKLNRASQKVVNQSFIGACKVQDFDLICYLLNSNRMKNKADIHANKDEGFKLAFIYGRFNILEYFIFELNIEKSKVIQEYLDLKHHHEDFYFNEKVKSMFILKEHQKLEQAINCEKIDKKKPKL